MKSLMVLALAARQAIAGVLQSGSVGALGKSFRDTVLVDLIRADESPVELDLRRGINRKVRLAEFAHRVCPSTQR